MPDSFSIESAPFGWVVALAVTVVAIGAIGALGYLLAARRVKQQLLVFMARFGVVFAVLFFAEYAFLCLVPSFHATMRHVTAEVVGRALAFAGVDFSVSGSIVTLQHPFLVFNVDVACLGGILLWAYTALVLAESKATARQRLAGIVMGLGVLLAFNLARITLSIYLESVTGVHVHDLFYLLNIVIVLLVWMGWLRTLRPPGPRVVVPVPYSEAERSRTT